MSQSEYFAGGQVPEINKVTMSDPQHGSVLSPEDTRHNTQY